MKLVKVIKKVVIGILAVIFFAFAITMTVLLLYFNKYGVTQFNDTSLIIIKDEISSNKYKKGDLVVVKKEKLDKINVGDEIFAYKLEDGGAVSIDLGKVGQVYLKERQIAFENGSGYSTDFIAGKPQKVYNGIGTYLSLLESPIGFLLTVLIPSFLIFIYEIYTLIVEIKYGKDETSK